MRIVIKYYCNNELRLDVKASDTIGQVKVMVQKKVRTYLYFSNFGFFRREFHRVDSACHFSELC
jgi:hypothetical protein